MAIGALELLKERLLVGVISTGTEIVQATTTITAGVAGLGGLATSMASGFRPGVKQGRGIIAAVATPIGALGAAGAFTTGLFLRDEVVKNLAGVVAEVAGSIGIAAVAATAVAGVATAVVGVATGVVGAELTGRATESFTGRIVRWMKE